MVAPSCSWALTAAELKLETSTQATNITTVRARQAAKLMLTSCIYLEQKSCSLAIAQSSTTRFCKLNKLLIDIPHC